MGAFCDFVYMAVSAFSCDCDWMYKEQYAKAGIKMLPVVEPDGKITAQQIVIFTIMLLPISVAPFFIGFSGIFYLIGSRILGIWFLYASIRAARAKTLRWRENCYLFPFYICH